jgi:hypothetical protein
MRAEIKERLAFRVLHDFATDTSDQLVVRHFGARVANDTHVGWQQAHLVECEQCRIRLALGEIARDTDNDNGNGLCVKDKKKKKLKKKKKKKKKFFFFFFFFSSVTGGKVLDCLQPKAQICKQ